MSSASASDTFADLRDYQVRAFDNIWDAFTVNKAQSTLVVHATGVGKTVLLAEVAKHAIHTLDWNVLFVAHRERLLTQTVAKFDRVGVDTCLEIADQKALRLVKSPKLAMMGDKAAKCVIGSVQTLKGKRLAAWPKDYFQLVIVDEAHHSPADSYLALINHFKSAKLLGVTATPDRLDGQNLGSIYRSVADKYFLPQAIREQWLAPVEWFKFKEKIDLRGLKCGKDFSDGELETRIMPLAERLCSDITMKIGSRPTMVFVPAKRSANLFADAFRQLGATAVAIHEDTPDRNAVEREFEHGEHQILVSCMVYTEGADFPFVESVVPLRATRSGALLCLDEKTEVLTKRGWVRHDQINHVDVAAQMDLETGEVTWSDILAKTVRRLEPNEVMYSLKSASTDIRVTANHRMVYRNRQGRDRHRTEWRIKEASDLAASQADHYEIPCAGIQEAPGLPLTDDEIRFIGWFLTDGTLRKDGHIAISQSAHQPYNADIVNCLNGCGFKYSVMTTTRKTQFSDSSTMIVYGISKGKPRKTKKHLRGWKSLERYINKNFDPSLDGLNSRQLGVLLEAIHLGDGAKQLNQSWTRRSYHIYTGNRRFAERLQSLCVRRGFRCNCIPQNHNRNAGWMLHIKEGVARMVGGSNANDRPKLQKCDSIPGETVWCIQTRNGTIFTRRNGIVSVLGNSQMVGRGTRPSPATGKENCLVLDFTWLCDKHKPVSAVTLMYPEASDMEIDLIERALGEEKQIDLLAAADRVKKICQARASKEEMDAIRQSQEKARLRVSMNPSNVGFKKVNWSGVTVEDVLGNKGKAIEFSKHVKKPTQRQFQALLAFGIEAKDMEGITARRASKYIDYLREEKAAGKSSYRQRKTLMKEGYSREEAAAFSAAEASKLIGDIIGKRSNYLRSPRDEYPTSRPEA